ncbi:MAG: polysaccharide biosynthesis/export family protein, partial [Gammaproteobacteria bacterium]
VTGFTGPFSDQIRVVGEAASPRALPFRANMTLLDLMISTGGLTDFADGNEAQLVRTVEGEQRAYRVRLYDLLKKGDITANQKVFPGDILIVPEALF